MEESDEPDITGTPVALVTVVNESTESPVHFSPASTAIVVEGDLVISSIPTFADAIIFILFVLAHGT